MTTNYSGATDQINQVFFDAWTANAAAVIGYVPEVRWQDVTEPDTPDGSKYWARVSIQTIDEPQTTFAVGVSGPDKRRYTAYGLVFVQLFGPKSDVTSSEKIKQLAEIAKNAYRGKATSGKVWFRNVRINELGPEELFIRRNVVAEFEYDEIA